LIYSDVARTLRDSRAYASSVTQLRMIDRVAYMLSDTFSEYKKFNAEAFLTQAEVGYDVPLNDMEIAHE